MLEEAQRNLDIENALLVLKDPSDDVDMGYFIWPDSEQDHLTLKALLVTSFSVQFRLGQVYWQKRFCGWQKDAWALRRIHMRVIKEMDHSLLDLPSACKGIASRELIGSQNPDDYTVDMGMGLFSSLDFYERDVIAVFKGALSMRAHMELPGFENHRAASITKFYALKKFESLFNTKIIIRKAKK